MRKIIYIAFLAGLFSVAHTDMASAWILTKISNMGEDVTTAISKVGKDVKNQLDKVGNLAVVKTVGKGFKESKDWTEKNVSKLKSFSDEVKDNAKAITDAVDEVKDSNIAKIKLLTDDVAQIKRRKNEIQQNIEEVSASINSTYDTAKAAVDGKKTKAIEEMSYWEKMSIQDLDNKKDEYKKKYDEAKAQMAQYEQEYNKLDADAKTAIKSATSVYTDELKGIQKDLDKLLRDLSALSGADMAEKSAEDALLNTTELYFLQFDEQLNPQRQDAIRRNRLLERRHSILEAYQESISFIPKLQTKNDEAEDQGYAASTFDTTAGAWGADADLKLKNLIALRDYARLQLYDLKMQTANEMSLLTFYKLKKPQKNITEFNLDDYVYKLPKGSK